MRSVTVLVDQVRIDQERELAFEECGVLGGRKNSLGVLYNEATAEATVISLPDGANAGRIGFGDFNVHLHVVLLKDNY
jgi:hypothetical protein